MKKILLMTSIICLFCACKKHNVEPAPQTDATAINKLPKKVTYSGSSYNSNVYEFTYYSSNLVKSILTKRVFNYDSTVFSYNAANQVINKIEYRDKQLYCSTYITYYPNGKTDSVNIVTTSGSIQYKYHYSDSEDMSYVLDYMNGAAAQDSIVMRDNSALYYANISIAPSTAETPNGFALWTSSPYYKSPSGIFSKTAVSLDIPVNIQLEVAESFLQLGMTDYPERNYYTISSPRKYCANVNNTTHTYTFDSHNRLVKVHGEYLNYAPSGSQIPGIFEYEVSY